MDHLRSSTEVVSGTWFGPRTVFLPLILPRGRPNLPLGAILMVLATYAWPDRVRAAEGPDVFIADLHEIRSYGTVDGVSAIAVGTTTCNIGDTRADWVWNTNRHPVFAQQLYRLADGRFEQLGLSWVKHAFFAESGTFCSGPGQCAGDPAGTHLGPGCSDVYTSSQNGQQGFLGPRGDVNAYTGVFPYPFQAPPPAPTIGRRLQFPFTEIDPATNGSSLFFVEVQIISPDDAPAGNGVNNVSHRPVLFSGSAASLSVVLTGQTQAGEPAIRAWRAADPEVVETPIAVPGEGQLILAARASPAAGGLWHYEYALYNANSDRGVRSFSIPIDPAATVSNVAFRDVHYHSGEALDGTDWSAVATGGTVAWATTPFDLDPNANALRWGTLYNFRFDADVPPVETQVTLGLFKPGAIATVTTDTVGPRPRPADCNGNGLPDACDLDCGPAGGECDLPGCGQSPDLDGNGAPDECDPDCNGNGLPDGWDVATGGSLDCNASGVPDECEPDGDSDGLIDDCDSCPLDADNDRDGDGVCESSDACPDDPAKIVPGLCGCGVADVDLDNDDTVDCLDNCPGVANADQSDQDADAFGDACDVCPLDASNDGDADGVCAPEDECPSDPFKLVPGLCGCNVPDGDEDGDSVPDCLDRCPGFDDRWDFDENGTPDCVENIPTVSQWGLLSLAILLLIGGKLFVRPRRGRGRYTP